MTGFQDLQKHSVWYDYGHKALALGVLYLMNKTLAVACKRAGVTFPSPLIGESHPEAMRAWHARLSGQ